MFTLKNKEIWTTSMTPYWYHCHHCPHFIPENGKITSLFSKNIKRTSKNLKFTHMWRRWGTPHNVFLAFIDKLEKQIIIKRTVEVGQQKTNNFNIYNVAFFLKKITKNTCRYHYQNLHDMIYSSWDIEQNKLKLVILGHFLPFIPLKTTKNQNFEK